MASIALLLEDLRDGAAEPLLGLRVRLERAALDHRLADGACAGESPALARRARQLATPQAAASVADRLDAVLRDLDRPPTGLTARVPLQRAQITAARPFVANLVERLYEVEHPRAQGVARALVLVTDGTSPLYAPAHPGALASRAWRATDAL